MKEFPFNLDGALVGLRPNDMGVNRPGCIECKGLLPIQGVGLQRIDWPELSPVETSIWPFPQLFKGNTVNMYLEGGAVYTIDLDTWKTTSITSELTIGHAWDFVDMNTAWVITNGKQVVTKNGNGTVTSYDEPVIESACYHRGRVVYAGLDSSFWNSTWQTEWNSWIDQQDSGLTTSFDFQKNSIYWTGIGAGDVFMPFDPTSMVSGPLASGFSNTRPFFMDLIARGDIGHMQMPWQGVVKRVLPLGKALMVYGDNGVSMLRSYMDPIPTYGEETMNRIGVPHHGCVGGDDTAHLYIDNLYDLHIVTAEGDKTLGYRAYMKMLAQGAIYIIKDPIVKYNRFYISDGVFSFCMTDTGLAQINQRISSVFHHDRRLLYTGSEDIDSLLVQTAPFNVGIEAIKQIRFVTIEYDNIDNLSVQVISKFDSQNKWNFGKVVRVVRQNAIPSMISGQRFMVRITGTPREGAIINSLGLRWSSVDKSGLRGPYGTDSTQQ